MVKTRSITSNQSALCRSGFHVQEWNCRDRENPESSKEPEDSHKRKKRKNPQLFTTLSMSWDVLRANVKKTRIKATWAQSRASWILVR